MSIAGTWFRNWEVAAGGDSYSRRALGVGADGSLRFQVFPAGEPLSAQQAQSMVINDQVRSPSAMKGVLRESYLLRQVLAVLHLLAELGHDVGYPGSWYIGLEVRGLRGYTSELYRENHGVTPTSRIQILDADTHRETTRVSAEQLANDPGAVLQRLAQRLLHGLNRTLVLPGGLR